MCNTETTDVNSLAQRIRWDSDTRTFWGLDPVTGVAWYELSGDWDKACAELRTLDEILLAS